MQKYSLARIALSLATALAGGAIFKLLQLPIPWLLGPMIAVLIGSSFRPDAYRWPPSFRNTGMIIVGYTMGLSLTVTAIREMTLQLPYMLMMTVLLILLCAGIAALVSRLSGMNYKTVLVGSIPGGLTQMLALAEETEDIDLTVVTVIQVVRLMVIIISTPLLVFSPLFGQHHVAQTAGAVQTNLNSPGWGGLFPELLIFAAVCIVCALAGNRIHFPTAFLLGPVIGTAVLQAIGLTGPELPDFLTNAAQLLIGSYVGRLLKPGNLPHKFRTISLALASSAVLILGALGLSTLLTLLQPISASTGLLSLAPGGMDQMSIIAAEVNADLSIVTGYQLFRLFFIFFLVPPFLKAWFKYGLQHGKS